MSMYRKEWPCCGDVTETNAWEPESCPFCTPAVSLAQPGEGALTGWQSIDSAPRGSGEDGPPSVRDPGYVAPPKLLLWTQEGPVVGYYDWYYHAGYGRGAEPGVSAWRDNSGGEAYGPTHWQPLPPPPGITSTPGDSNG